MKRSRIFTAMIVLVIIACSILLRQGMVYLVASLMAIVIMGAIYRNRSWGMKITRWAKSNPRKTQGLITLLQIALTAMGIIAGNNFKELGFKFSNTTAYVFGTLMVIGYLSVPFLNTRSTIAIPKVVNRHRLFYMCIALSSFVMTVYTGNRIADIFPHSPVSHAIETIDQYIFPDNSVLLTDIKDVALDPANTNDQKNQLIDETSGLVVFASYILPDNETIAPPTELKKESKANLKAQKKAMKLEKKKARLIHRFEKHRMTLAAGLTGGAIVLIILLILLTCAGACLVVGGIIALVDGTAGGILAILAGLFLGWLAIRGIIKINKSEYYQKKEEKL
jgi:hypothetical protein